MEGDSWLYGSYSVSLQIALKGSMVAAALVSPDYFTVVWASVLGVGAVTAAFLAWQAKSLFPPGTCSRVGELRGLREFSSYSVYTWPVPVLLYLQVVLTQIVVRWRIDNDAVGLLTSVNVFVGVVSAFQAGFATFWSGYMYRNYRTQVARIKRMHDYLALFAIGSMAAFVLFREQLFVLLGVDYHPTKPFFALLLVSPLLLILSETTAYGVGIARKSHLLLVVTAVSVAANVGLTWGLAPALGLVGACAGSVVSGVVLFAGQTYFGQKYFSSIDRPSRTTFAVVVLLVLSLVNLQWSDDNGIRIGLSVGCLMVVVGVYRKAVYEVLKAARQAVPAIG
jgi:O-antigen/teichoic acid export membrane protein